MYTKLDWIGLGLVILRGNVQRTAIIGLKRFQMARVVEMKGTKLKGTLPSAFSIGYCNVCTNQPTTLGVCTLCRHSAPFLSYQNLALLLRNIQILRSVIMIHDYDSFCGWSVQCQVWTLIPHLQFGQGLNFLLSWYLGWLFCWCSIRTLLFLSGREREIFATSLKYIYIYIYYKSSRPDSHATMTLSP